MKQAISWPRAVPVLCGIALGAASAGPVAAAQPQPWEVNLQPAGSPIMEMIHAFSNGTLILMSLIVLLVLSLLVVVMIRFNARRNPVPSKTSHNTLIEVIWTVGPVVILVLFLTLTRNLWMQRGEVIGHATKHIRQVCQGLNLLLQSILANSGTDHADRVGVLVVPELPIDGMLTR